VAASPARAEKVGAGRAAKRAKEGALFVVSVSPE
jgi:hypothetical protein